jgi:hypothetical protein
MTSKQYRRGDLVRVRTPAEILATLDANGRLQGLPFMPEMAAYCGLTFTVTQRAEKICDTVNLTGSRRMPNSVLLDVARCNGAAHGGCQAECRFFWKDDWLSDPGVTSHSTASDPNALATLLELTQRQARMPTVLEGETQERWSCQATSLVDATYRVGTFNPLAYVHEYIVGNVPLRRLIRVGVRAAWEEPARKLGLTPKVYMSGTAVGKTDDGVLNLQPGELVQVKRKEEILATLSATGHNRGLWFDREFAPLCGKVFRVRKRVTRFIDEYRGGRMVELKTDAVTLEGVACTGDLSQRRWLCPRNAIPFWRECWLRRVEG